MLLGERGGGYPQAQPDPVGTPPGYCGIHVPGGPKKLDLNQAVHISPNEDRVRTDRSGRSSFGRGELQSYAADYIFILRQDSMVVGAAREWDIASGLRIVGTSAHAAMYRRLPISGLSISTI